MELPEGPKRTAALAAWVQGLFGDQEEAPVLIGGAVVELLTGGGYTTGDLDFAGSVPREVARQLEAEGFRRQGRQWVHREAEIFLDFPANVIDPEEGTTDLSLGDLTVLALSPEAVIVDRLAAWQFWGSQVDAVNAYLVWRACAGSLDRSRLERLVKEREVESAFNRLMELVVKLSGEDPSSEELRQWAEREP